MRNLHFVLVDADSAKEAARFVESELLDSRQCFSIGGVASKSGKDDIENDSGDSSYPLSSLDTGKVVEGTYFEKAVKYLKKQIKYPVTLYHMPGGTYQTFEDALQAVRDYFSNTDTGKLNFLALLKNIKHLEALRSVHRYNSDIPEFYEWEFEEFGLTKMHHDSEEKEEYIVFVDIKI
nr:hypothetical protein 30 [bacterium]